MRTAVIRVSFSRQVSDGNYGSETIRHEVEVVAEDDEDLSSEESITALALCRRLVHSELAQSPNWSIRRAVEDVSKPRADEAPVWAGAEEPDPEDLPL